MMNGALTIGTRDGDQDRLIMNLLAAEITARTGRGPGEHYQALMAEFRGAYCARIDAPETLEQKSKLERLSPQAVKAPDLAGEPIIEKLTRAPGSDAPIGGGSRSSAQRLVRGAPVGHRGRLQDLR